MKVLYITNGDGYAGDSIALENIISCLKDKIDIEVVFPRRKGDFSKKLEAMGIKCYHFRYTMNVYPSESMCFIRKVLKILYITLLLILKAYAKFSIFKLLKIHLSIMSLSLLFIDSQ